MRQIIGELNPCLIVHLALMEKKSRQWQVILTNAVDPAITLPRHIDNAIGLLLEVSLSRDSVHSQV